MARYILGYKAQRASCPSAQVNIANETQIANNQQLDLLRLWISMILECSE